MEFKKILQILIILPTWNLIHSCLIWTNLEYHTSFTIRLILQVKDMLQMKPHLRNTCNQVEFLQTQTQIVKAIFLYLEHTVVPYNCTFMFLSIEMYFHYQIFQIFNSSSLLTCRHTHVYIQPCSFSRNISRYIMK